MEQTPSDTASPRRQPAQAARRACGCGAGRRWRTARTPCCSSRCGASRGACEKYHGAVIGHAGRSDTRVFREVAAARRGARPAGRRDARRADAGPGRAAVRLGQLVGAGDLRRPVPAGALPAGRARATTGRCGTPGVDVDVVAGDRRPVRLRRGRRAGCCTCSRATWPRGWRRWPRAAARCVTTFLSGRVDEDDNAFLTDVPGPLGPLMGVRVDEWDARAADVVNPVLLERPTLHRVGSRLLFELVDPAGRRGRRHVPAPTSTPARRPSPATRSAPAHGWYVAAGLDEAGVSLGHPAVLDRHGLAGPYADVARPRDARSASRPTGCGCCSC